MPSKSKSKSNNGCVGIASGGVLKVSTVHVFHCDESEPNTYAQGLVNYFGDKFEIKYVPVSDPVETFDKFLETLDQKERVGETSLFRIAVTDASRILKDVADVKACKTFSLKRQSKKEEEDSEAESEGEQEQKQEKSSKDKKTKKAESEAESADEHHSEDEDDKRKKKDTSSRKSKKPDPESEAESEEEQSDEEKTNKLRKKGSKKTEKKTKSK